MAVGSGARWDRRYTFSPAVKAGDFLFISGMIATDDEGNLVGDGDIVAQTAFIYGKMERLLASIGASCADIVETTDYFLTLEDYARTAEVRRHTFGGPPFPAATGVLVAGLIRPGALIEIKATALLRHVQETP